jgi:active breakpoint cluster region-related protein
LDIKVTAAKKDINKFSKSSDLIAEEFGKKLAKSESLKSTQSSSGSLGSRDTKSTASPTGSLEKISRGGNSVGSKESINSGVASQKIKSFESISSLSSDSVKIGQHIESEPFYDTVPIEAHDDGFVYIQSGNKGHATDTMTSTGTTGSSSSRDEVLSNAGSTLPMNMKNHLSSQTSVVEPESPGRSSNYVNIDYFLK